MPFDPDELVALSRPFIQRKPWMEEKKMELIRTAADLHRVVDECIESKLYALDLETTGLDNRVFNGATRSHIVGVCISPDGVRGYYVPVRHPEFMENCVPFSAFATEMRRLVKSEAVAIFHNGKFDHEFLQFNGGEPIGEWDEPRKWEDTLILAYLRNTRERNKGLKFLTKNELGMEMIELEELFPEEEVKAGKLNFGSLDPMWEPALWYGASDAICTYLLYQKIRGQALDPTESGLPNQSTIYTVEKLCVAATRWMERCRIPIARDIVTELIRVGRREWLPALREVYESASVALGRNIAPGYFRLLADPESPLRFVPEDVDTGIMEAVDNARREAEKERMDDLEPDGKGRMKVKTIQKRVPNLVDPKSTETVDFPLVYDVLIADALGLLLRELGVQGLNVTEKSGQIKTSKDELDRVIEEAGEEYPYIAKVKRFRQVAKAISTNLQPIYEASDKLRSLDGRIKINFEAFKVDTARFSTPQEREGRSEITGKANWNIHSIPSGRGKDIPDCLKRIREVIRAEPGRKLYAIDYSGQELRVVTNLSREPMWEAEFFRCAGCNHEFDRGGTVPPPPEPPPPFCPKCGGDSIGDLHTLTAIAIYGPDVKDDPEFKSKRNNSKGVNFGLCYGGGGMAVVRAANVSKDEGWRIKNKFDKTYKGLAGWWARQHEYARRTGHVLTAFNRRYPVPDIDSADGGFRSKAERNSVNGPIQGCLHPGSRVPTDGGYLRVEDLYLRGTDFKVWTGRGWSAARPLISGEKRLVETVLEDGGTLLTSPEHLFRVWDTTQHEFIWVRQHDMQKGDWCARDSAPLVLPTPTYSFSDEGVAHNAHGFRFEGNHPVLWEMLGRLIGDGSLRSDGFVIHVGEAPVVLADEAVACGYTAEKHARAFADRIRMALGVETEVVEKVRADGDTRRNTWQIQVWNTAFVRFCTEMLGLKVANCLDKEFPAAVWGESVENRAAFLRGYMDADGGITPNLDHLGVRSANPTLLREAYLLLRSVGVRAALRKHSRFTTVLDREAYRDVIGFSVEYKAARLSRVVSNPQAERNTRLPPDLVKEIGEILHGSPGYANLSRAQKSAVLRLCAGSGSKAQCLRLMSSCNVVVIGDRIREALDYDYSRVSAKHDTGESILMYDVEVLDESHAFPCDGVIVHNTGADLMKYAMGLIYRECKKRGWLDKCRAIITIHDELVFEIDDDIAAEAVPVMVDIMLKKTTSKLPWRVPLTVDIECGFDWTVPWNITKIMYGKKPLPPELVGVFVPYAQAAGAATQAAPNGVEMAKVVVDAQTPPTASVDEAHGGEAPPTHHAVAPPLPSLAQGEVFTYTIQSSRLTMRMLNRIAKVIHMARGRGTHPFRIVTETGESLWDGEEIFVNPAEVTVYLNMPEM